jgi:rod shape-determining protein MreC
MAPRASTTASTSSDVSDLPVKSNRRGRWAAPSILLASSLLCLTISTRSLAGVPERVGLTVVGFFQRQFASIGVFFADTITSIAELSRLRQSYDELAAKMERYTGLERGYAELKIENSRLKSLLGFSEKLAYERIAARVTAKDPDNLYSTFVIDRGAEAGIRKNMAVIAMQDGIEGLVGKIVEAGRGSSVVVPLYDSSSFVAARLSELRYEGLVNGQGSSDAPLIMRFVRKRAKDEAQFGDLVVTSGYESIYPPEVAIGRIQKIHVLDYLTSIDIDLEPVIDFTRLEYVFIVTAGASP